jgi:hypothetical protein
MRMPYDIKFVGYKTRHARVAENANEITVVFNPRFQSRHLIGVVPGAIEPPIFAEVLAEIEVRESLRHPALTWKK